MRTFSFHAFLLLVLAYCSASFVPAARAAWELTSDVQRRIAQVKSGGARIDLLRQLSLELANDRRPDPARLERFAAELKRIGPELTEISVRLQAIAAHWRRIEQSSFEEVLRLAVDNQKSWSVTTLDEQRRLLRDALLRCEAWLKQRGPNRAAWETYLHWNETRSLLEISSLDPSLLDRLETRWSNAVIAWNEPELLRTAFSVRRFIEQARRSLDDQFPSRALASLTELSDLMSQADSLRDDEHARLADALACIEPYGVAPELTTSIRRRASYPNAVMRFSPAVFKIDRKINETFPINGVYSGAQTSGTGQIIGNLTCNPTDEVGTTGWKWVFAAMSTANTRSFSSGIQVNTQSNTQISGAKLFRWDATGLATLPATALATTTVRTTGISGGGRAARAAQGQVNANRAQNEAESSRSAENNVRARLDQEGQALVNAFSKQYDNIIRQPLLGTKEFVTSIRTESSRSALNWSCWLELPHGCAAPHEPPSRSAGSAASFCWHETFLERFAAIHLAGRTVTSAELQAELQRWRDQIAPSGASQKTPAGKPEPASPKSPVTLTFEMQRPLTCKIHDGQIELQFRLSQLATESTTYPALSAQLLLRPHSGEQGWALEKAASVEVSFLNEEDDKEKRLSGRQLALRRAVQRMLEDAVPAKLAIEPFSFTGNSGALPALAPEKIEATAGWLMMDWRILSGKLKPSVAQASLN